MGFNCFRSAGSKLSDDQHPAPRPAKKSSWPVRRNNSSESAISNSSSLKSNESISKLPPCNRASDPAIEALMMPLPYDPREGKCMRLKDPRFYSSLVSDMKAAKGGCRDWKSFAVFEDDAVVTETVDEAERKHRLLCERIKLRKLRADAESGASSNGSIGVDMIC